jgi:flavin-dependent dehydrogenase
MNSASHTNETFDVIIIGGSFSGASSALLLKRKNPDLRVLIVEKSEHFDYRVGESTSEVSGCFLTKVLKVSHHLSCKHFQKNGLRLWFNAPGNQDAGRCTEIGPFSQSRFPTYQLDRSLLDEHLINTAREEGCTVMRPAHVKEINLHDEQHEIVIKQGDQLHTFECRWLIDASGKAAVLARKLDLLQPLPSHPVNSMWVRFTGVKNLDTHDVQAAYPALQNGPNVSRSSATNHLMGHGWWSWIIPLSNGDFSAGVTYDERIYTPPAGDSLSARIKEHLVQHPMGKLLFQDAMPVANDAKAYKHLPYYSKQVAGPNWICVGDAAGFMDPLYSQGLDYCSHTVYSAYKIVSASLAGECVKQKIAMQNQTFGESYSRWYHGIYHNKYHYMGDADCMNAAFLMDIAAYFIGPVRLVYEDTDSEFALMPYNGPAGKVFADFMALYNRRLAAIAGKLRANDAFGENNLDQRYYVRKPFDKGTGSLRHMLAGIKIWLKLEWRALWLTGEKVPHPMQEPQVNPVV